MLSTFNLIIDFRKFTRYFSLILLILNVRVTRLSLLFLLHAIYLYWLREKSNEGKRVLFMEAALLVLAGNAVKYINISAVCVYVHTWI